MNSHNSQYKTERQHFIIANSNLSLFRCSLTLEQFTWLFVIDIMRSI